MSVSATENAGPGPGELQDPLWVKMNAITGITKKRKKSDAKPQSQINKCLNEKKRRTQENLYIDELAELISATDMSSGKTDKCQILQRTVDQIQHIRQQEGNNSHAVQQGEVSSSNPSILSSDQVGPILLEALDGFLFVVNTEGRIEYVTDNIQLYINYTKDDVLGKDIYNIIHHGDHQSFMPSCTPTSIDWVSGPHPQSRNRTFICRFLVKPPDEKDETMEEKQQRVSKYESMQVCSALLPNTGNRSESGGVTSESSDIGPCVMCVARRIPINEQPVNTIPIQQFTVKLDTTGRISAVDTSNLTIPNCQYLSKELVGTTIQDLCHPHDLSILTTHLKDILQVGEGTTPLYRLRISPDKFVNVQTNSRYFKGNVMNGHCADFIMSNHSIIWDNDLTPSEGGQLSNSKVCSGHSRNHCANNISNNNGNNNNNVSGQLMTVAHVNGQVSGISARTLATTTNPSVIPYDTSDTLHHQINSQTTSNPFNHFSTNVDLEYELFPNSSWDLDSNSGCGGDTPESRNNPSSNSRPPSQPAPTASSPQAAYTSNSVVTSHCSPLRAYSPTSMISAHSFSNSFPFSPLQDSQQTLISGAGVINGGSSSSGAGTSAGSIAKDARRCTTPNHTGIESIGPIGTSTSSTTSISTAVTTSVSTSSSSSNTTAEIATSAISVSDTSTASSSLSGAIMATAVTTTTTSTSSITPASLSVTPTTNLLTTTESQSTNLNTTTDSGRLRNLLTKGVNINTGDDTQDSGSGSVGGSNNDTESQNNHRILKILLNQQDDDDYHSEHNAKVRTNANIMPKTSEHSKASLGNNMLLQLLNEKNDDDDDTRAGLKKQNELLQQLLKEPEEERKIQEQKNRDDDSLLRSLGFRSSTPPLSQSSDHGHGGTSQSGQKRPGEDGDLNMAVKRPMDGTHQVSSSGSSTTSQTPSKLWERNKMLASLLAKEPSQPTIIPPIPASVISATPQDKLPRVAERMKQQQQQPWNISGMQSVGSTATTSVATSARTPLQNQSRQLPRQATNIYLNQIQSHDRPQMSQMDSEFAGSGEFRAPVSESNTWDNQSSDPDLSDILDQVIDFVPDEVITDSSTIANLLDVIEAPQNNPMNEKMAINAIQKSLMLCENAVNPTSSTITMPTTPPAYSSTVKISKKMAGGTPATTTHSYQPPPMYQQQTRARFTGQAGIRQTATPFTQQQQQQQQQLQLQLQRNKLLQQQQLKQRLLQQQQQQQLLIPSNATAPDQISGIHNIDNLLNNTVAPNVSLQRSSVSDSQISPGYGGSVQLSNTHRLPHSYSHQSTINQHSVVTNNFNSGQQVSASARLSPHSPGGILSFSHPQPLSPRVSQGNYVTNPRMFTVNQARAQQQQQQQSTTQQQLQQQRPMPSPGTAVPARQSPYPAEVFPPPASPTASQFPPVPNPASANPTAQFRLQRASSTPTATTQLPGGIGSPRNYGGVTKDQQQSLLSPNHPRGACQPTSTHNQHNITHQNQHFANQQHTSMLYQQTGNNVSNQDMQKNQFCYEQGGSVSVYSSGSEDPRSMSSINPANHQMGGNTSGPGSMTSEFVRQELRAVVGARTQQRVPNNIQNNLIGQVSQDELEALGLSFEMSPAEYYGGGGSR